MANSNEIPVLQPGHTYTSISEKISEIPLTKPLKTPRGWLVGFAISFFGMMVFLFAVAYLFVNGVGIWGINIPVGWAFAILNFVWWLRAPDLLKTSPLRRRAHGSASGLPP